MGLLPALAGALPALAVMAYVDKLDARRPEPRGTLRRVTVGGAVGVLPCAALEAGFDRVVGELGLAGDVLRALFVVAVVEEAAKACSVRLFAWTRLEFDERLDGIVYGSRAGLGFALVENILYLAAAESTAGFATTFLVRALFTVPLHAACGALVGYYAARKRFDGAGGGAPFGYALAVGLHGTFDALALVAVARSRAGSEATGIAALSAAALLALAAVALVRRKARRALSLDEAERRAARAT